MTYKTTSRILCETEFIEQLLLKAVKYVSEDYCIDHIEDIERLKHIKFV